MAQAVGTISMRVDPELKQQASDLFNDLGIDLSAAINMFLKQSVAEQALPFQPAKRSQRELDIDRFMAELKLREELNEGKPTLSSEQIKERFGI